MTTPESNQPDTEQDRPQAGVPDGTVTDETPALGTSEVLSPVQGVHTPDVGPGGEQFDTEEPGAANRTGGTG